MKAPSLGVLLGLALSGMLAAPAVLSDSFKGKINGHGCAHEGKVCPIDRLDPHVALERDFVLQDANGDYMFMLNVPRSVKVRHVLSDVEVIGKLDSRYRSLDVDELRVVGRDGTRTVWSKKQQQAEYENFYSEGQMPIFN